MITQREIVEGRAFRLLQAAYGERTLRVIGECRQDGAVSLRAAIAELARWIRRCQGRHARRRA